MTRCPSTVESGVGDIREVGSGTAVTPEAAAMGLGVGLGAVSELQDITNSPAKAVLSTSCFTVIVYHLPPTTSNDSDLHEMPNQV